MQILSSKAGTVSLIMLRRHMMAKMCAAAILCSSGGVSSQTIYKQIDATGRTTFSDRPAAVLGAPSEMFPGQERGLGSSPRIASGTRSDVARALASNSGMSSIYAATIDFNEATRRLRQARNSRHEGIEPRAGEWADSTATSALNNRYQRRQQKLEREVVAAELRSHETSLVRSALLRSALSRSDAETAPPRLAQP